MRRTLRYLSNPLTNEVISCGTCRKDLGALQTNVEYLTDRIINNNSNNGANITNPNANNYAALSHDDQNMNLVAHSSNDFDNNIMEAQNLNQEIAIDHNEGTRDQTFD